MESYDVHDKHKLIVREGCRPSWMESLHDGKKLPNLKTMSKSANEQRE
jgi:hypothetical protein